MPHDSLGCRFSFGPWNIHERADPFGPPVRLTVPWAKKLVQHKALGFEGVQLHDNDAVPDAARQIVCASRSAQCLKH